MTGTAGGLELSIGMSGEHFAFHSSRRGPKQRFGFTWTLAPGKSGPPEHVHPGETESFRVVSGVLRVFVRDARVDLGPGDTIAVPPATPHRFHNPGAVPVVVEVELDGTAMEDQMIPTALHFRAVGQPRARDFARMVVHDVALEASVPTSAAMRAFARGLLAVLRGVGFRGFEPVHGWDQR